MFSSECPSIPFSNNVVSTEPWAMRNLQKSAIDQGGVTYIGTVHIAATGVKILDRPKISLDLLTTPDLCP